MYVKASNKSTITQVVSLSLIVALPTNGKMSKITSP